MVGVYPDLEYLVNSGSSPRFPAAIPGPPSDDRDPECRGGCCLEGWQLAVLRYGPKRELGYLAHTRGGRSAGADYHRLGGGFAPEPSPDGRDVAFHSLRNGSDNRDIFVMRVGGGPAIQVSTSPGDDRVPHWSPDGRALAWNDNRAEKDAILVSRRRGDGSWSPPIRFTGVGGRWTPDGQISCTDSLGFGLLNPESGARTRLFPGGILNLAYYVWSSDQRTLYMPWVDSLGRVLVEVRPRRADQDAGLRGKSLAAAIPVWLRHAGREFFCPSPR